VNIHVDPRKVKHVEMKDGTRYPVGRNGTVAITRPDHERAVEHGMGQHDMAETGFLRPRIGFVSTGRKDCDACGFGAWPWQTVCPRCGADL
jgi:hypothetical protein